MAKLLKHLPEVTDTTSLELPAHFANFMVEGVLGRKAQPGKPHNQDCQLLVQELFEYQSSRYSCNISKNVALVKFVGFR